MDLSHALSLVTSLSDERKKELLERYIKKQLTDEDVNDLVYHLTLAETVLKQEKNVAVSLLQSLKAAVA